jgi:hypothetical protein
MISVGTVGIVYLLTQSSCQLKHLSMPLSQKSRPNYLIMQLRFNFVIGVKSLTCEKSVSFPFEFLQQVYEVSHFRATKQLRS